MIWFTACVCHVILVGRNNCYLCLEQNEYYNVILSFNNTERADGNMFTTTHSVIPTRRRRRTQAEEELCRALLLLFELQALFHRLVNHVGNAGGWNNFKHVWEYSFIETKKSFFQKCLTDNITHSVVSIVGLHSEDQEMLRLECWIGVRKS